MTERRTYATGPWKCGVVSGRSDIERWPSWKRNNNCGGVTAMTLRATESARVTRTVTRTITATLLWIHPDTDGPGPSPDPGPDLDLLHQSEQD